MELAGYSKGSRYMRDAYPAAMRYPSIYIVSHTTRKEMTFFFSFLVLITHRVIYFVTSREAWASPIRPQHAFAPPIPDCSTDSSNQSTTNTYTPPIMETAPWFSSSIIEPLAYAKNLHVQRFSTPLRFPVPRNIAYVRNLLFFGFKGTDRLMRYR